MTTIIVLLAILLAIQAAVALVLLCVASYVTDLKKSAVRLNFAASRALTDIDRIRDNTEKARLAAEDLDETTIRIEDLIHDRMVADGIPSPEYDTADSFMSVGRDIAAMQVEITAKMQTNAESKAE